MATIVRTYVHPDTGHTINVYESGAERDTVTGKLVKPAAATVIRTAEKATELHRRRQEKHAARLRQAIAAAAAAGLPEPVRTSADAFAVTGAMIFEQVVMNSEAYPRDRLEAWEKLGKYAQVLPADIRQTADPADGTAAAVRDAAAANAAAAVMIAKVLQDVLTAQQAQPPADAVDGTVVDIGTAAPPLPPPPVPAAQPQAADAAAAQPPHSRRKPNE